MTVRGHTSTQSRWYYAREHEEFGPISFTDLQAMVVGGALKATDQVRQEGTVTWSAVAEVGGLEQRPASAADVDVSHNVHGASRRPFTTRFFDDLRNVHQWLADKHDPKACLPTLLKRFNARRDYLERFAADLANVLETTDQNPRGFLPNLAQRFTEWRADVEKQIEDYLKRLHIDDPLKCAISLFGTMDCGRLERAHTKVLAWLLDPNKEHMFEGALLRRLLRFLALDISDRLDFGSVRVTAEKWIDGGNRLDIFVEGKIKDDHGNQKNWFMVIEAKIDAVESPNQLLNYDMWIESKLSPAIVTRVFLTPHGRAAGSSKQFAAWRPLTLLQLAGFFRDELTALEGKAGYHFLRHYLTGILKDIYRWQLPILDPKQCLDPYRFLAYMAAVES